MKSLVILHGPSAWKVISSSEYSTYPMGDVYRRISDDTGLEFSSVIRLMDELPVFLSGSEHKERRKSMAKTYAHSRTEQERVVNDVVRKIATRIEQTNGSFNLLDEISTPIWHAISSVICQNNKTLRGFASDLPELFNPDASVNLRKRLNDQLESFLEETDDNLLDQLALLVLGVRPLTGSIVLSLHKLARDNAGQCLCDISFPESFPDSALRFVDRIALHDVHLNGRLYQAGTRFRCVTFDESYTSEQNANNVYGQGAHVCLGKPISQYTWGKIGEVFSNSKKRTQPGKLITTEREPFLIATKCFISLSA